MTTDSELRRRIHDLADSTGPWPDPLDAVLRQATSERSASTDQRRTGRWRDQARTPWLPWGVMASIAVGMAIVIATVLLLKPGHDDAGPAGPVVGISTPPTIVQPAPVACEPVPVSTGFASSYVRATITATPVVVPGQSVVVDATITDLRNGNDGVLPQTPLLYRDEYLQILLIQHGAVIGELQPDPELNPVGHATPGDSYVNAGLGNVLGGGARYLQVAGPGCPAPDRPAAGLALPAGSYQVVSVLGYSRSASGPAKGQIVSAPATVDVLKTGGPDATHGMITGTLVVSGGPAPGEIVGIPGRVSVYATATPSETALASTSADAHGNFALTLAPGTYYLAGTSPNVLRDDNQQACGFGLVRVASGSVATAVVGCAIP